MRLRRIALFALLTYLMLTTAAGIFLCEATLHPARRPSPLLTNPERAN